MMMKLLGGLSLPVALACTTLAYADPDYTASSIIEHFKAELEQGQQNSTGGTRSVFIGASGFGESDTTGPDTTGPDTTGRDEARFNLLVNFEYNSERLVLGAKRNLDEFAQALSDPAMGSARFSVEGHTDATGSDEYNLALSERRAGAVVSYLIAKGVAASRLVARGFGEQRFLSDRPNDPINRRVETRLIE